MITLQGVTGTDLKLLLSNPPHEGVDPVAAARIFGVTTAEARIRLNCPGPEVWFAADDPSSDLESKAAALSELGARSTVTSARRIAGVADRLQLRRFVFKPSALECGLVGVPPLTIPYDWSVTAVVCRPVPREIVVRKTLRQAAREAKPDKSHRQRARVSLTQLKTPVDESFVDLYFVSGPQMHRATIRPGSVDYSPLGAAKSVVERESVTALIAELRKRFASLVEDRRLENAPAPRITVVGSRTLRGHLEMIEPRLKNVDDYDLMSRLAYLSNCRSP